MKNEKLLRYGAYLLAILLVFAADRYVGLIPTATYLRLRIVLLTALLCASGYFSVKLIVRSDKVRSRYFFAAITLMVFIFTLTNWISFVFSGYGAYDGAGHKASMNFLVNYANMTALGVALYPIEIVRPKWLTVKKLLLFFAPIVIIGAIGYVPRNAAIASWSDLRLVGNGVTFLRRVVMICYVVLPYFMAFYYKRRYNDWCQNNYSTINGGGYDISWLNNYLFFYLLISLSYIVVIVGKFNQTTLVHDLLFLIFVVYGGSKAARMRNPYADANIEIAADNSEPTAAENKKFEKEIDADIKILEQWLATERPYRDKDFKLTDLMRILPLNRSYLFRLLNDGMGVTFFQLAMRYRIAESEELLINRPELTVAQIAEQCGFSSPSVFGRAFLKERGVTPKQFRTDNVKA